MSRHFLLQYCNYVARAAGPGTPAATFVTEDHQIQGRSRPPSCVASESREMFALVAFHSRPIIVTLLLYAVIAMMPLLADAGGGTRVVVNGEGFPARPGVVHGGCQFTPRSIVVWFNCHVACYFLFERWYTCLWHTVLSLQTKPNQKKVCITQVCREGSCLLPKSSTPLL